MLDRRIYAYCEEDITNISGFDRSELVSAEEGRFVMHAHPGPDCGNNIGTVHGGFLLALADTAGTGAIDTLGRENATMSVNSNFLRPAYTTDEYLEVVGTVLKRGKRVVVAEVTISRPNGELCLKATLTSAVFDSRIIDLPRLANI